MNKNQLLFPLIFTFVLSSMYGVNDQRQLTQPQIDDILAHDEQYQKKWNWRNCWYVLGTLGFEAGLTVFSVYNVYNAETAEDETRWRVASRLFGALATVSSGYFYLMRKLEQKDAINRFFAQHHDD